MIQSVLGLVPFDSDDFTVTNGWVTPKANEVDFADLVQLDSNIKYLLELTAAQEIVVQLLWQML